MKSNFRFKLILIFLLFFTVSSYANEVHSEVSFSIASNYKYSYKTGHMLSLETGVTLKSLFLSFEGGKVLDGDGFELYGRGGDGLYFLVHMGIYLYKGHDYMFYGGIAGGKGYPDKNSVGERSSIDLLSLSLNIERKINKYNAIMLNLFIIVVEPRATDVSGFLPLPGVGIKYILRY